MKKRRLAIVGRVASFLFATLWTFLAIFDKNLPPAMVSALIIFVISIVSWFFIVSYHFYSIRDDAPWWRNEMGRHVMAFVAVDAGIFSFLGGATIWPSLAKHAWYVWLYFGTVSGIAWVTLWRISILYRSVSPSEQDATDDEEVKDEQTDQLGNLS